MHYCMSMVNMPLNQLSFSAEADECWCQDPPGAVSCPAHGFRCAPPTLMPSPYSLADPFVTENQTAIADHRRRCFLSSRMRLMSAIIDFQAQHSPSSPRTRMRMRILAPMRWTQRRLRRFQWPLTTHTTQLHQVRFALYSADVMMVWFGGMK